MAKKPSPQYKMKFITPMERRRMIEAAMRHKGWSWYMLSKAMNMDQTAVQKALKVEDDTPKNPRLNTIKACARALDVPAGILIDRRGRRK